MADLKAYDVNGTTLLLSDEDAQRRGLTGGTDRAATYSTPPNNTDGTPEQEAARNPAVSTTGVEETTTKARASSNK
jgi:hypothetical protein